MMLTTLVTLLLLGDPLLRLATRTLASPDADAGPLLMTATGNGFSCSISARNNQVSCWGANPMGQLAKGDTVDVSVPVPFGNGVKARAVACGTSHTCIIDMSKKVQCAGTVASGEGGVDPAPYKTLMGAYVTSLVQTTTASGMGAAASICASQYYTCIVQESDKVPWCFGSNLYGVMGRRPETAIGFAGSSFTPRPIPGLEAGVSDFSCGTTHTCFISASTGQLGCLGFNNYGQISNAGASGVFLDPVWVQGQKFVSVATGIWHTCAVDTAGAVWCSGWSRDGQAGVSTASDGRVGVLTRVPGLPGPAVSVTGSTTYTIAMLGDGSAFYMGANSYGQAADGTVGAKARWAPFANGAKLAVVEAGFYHTCFTLRGASSGLVRCAGFNLQGTLGGGTRGGSSSTPVTVVFGSGGTGGDSKPPALAPQNRPTTLRPSPTARPTVRSKRGGRGRRLSALAA